MELMIGAVIFTLVIVGYTIVEGITLLVDFIREKLNKD